MGGGEKEEVEEETKTILRNAFGESSDEDEELEDPVSEGVTTWERIREINGLWICRNFLSPDQQSSLLSSVHKEGWLDDSSRNQAMRFGDLPSWAVELSNAIREAVFFSHCPSESLDLTTCEDDGEEGSPFASHLLWREPLFDQLILNTYQPGEGICAHVDLMRFEDGISIVSLESPCVMHFTPVRSELSDNGDDDSIWSPVKIPVYLSEGSLVLMSGEARYHWKHEINRKPGFQKWEGEELVQRNRTSITLRKLYSTA